MHEYNVLYVYISCMQTLTPVCAPAVAADPVVHSVLISAPAVQLDGVVEHVGMALTTSGVRHVIHTHTTSITMQTAVEIKQ